MLIDFYNHLTSQIHTFASDLAGGDSMAKGLIVVGIIGGLVALLKTTPRYVKKLILRKYTISIKAEYNWENRNKDLYKIITEFVAKHQVNKNFIAYTNLSTGKYTDSNIKLSPDYESGFFFHKGKPYHYCLENSKEQGAVQAAITVTTLGRSAETIWNDIEPIRKLNEIGDSRKYYKTNKGEWEEIEDIGKSSPMFIPKAIKETIDKKLDFYLNNKKWYNDRGISRKVLIIVHGVPGTGKSRLARYVADYLGYSLGTISDGVFFTERMREASKKEMVVSIPDFDTLNITNSRDIDESEEEDKNVSSEDISSDNTEKKPKKEEPKNVLNFEKFMSSGSLGEVLNVFQGDIPLNNLVTVMSTNCISKVDKALLRRGRTDILIELGSLTYDEVTEFYKHHYELTTDLPEMFKTIKIKACDMQAAFEDNAFSSEDFVNEIKKFIK